MTPTIENSSENNTVLSVSTKIREKIIKQFAVMLTQAELGLKVPTNSLFPDAELTTTDMTDDSDQQDENL